MGDDPAAAADDPCAAGAEATAASALGWGAPTREDGFDGPLDPAWQVYDGTGFDGQGTRTAEALATEDGILTITGDAEGATGGMAWGPGQMYGRWEARVRTPASDPSYNALLLLWPDDESGAGSEVDFMEMLDPTRQTANAFLHGGEDGAQVMGEVAVDGTQWHNWAVEWTPTAITAYVDGVEWWRVDDPALLPKGPMHLCVQLDWFPTGDEGAVQESSMQVDWVRQHPADAPAAGDGPADDAAPADDTTANADPVEDGVGDTPADGTDTGTTTGDGTTDTGTTAATGADAGISGHATGAASGSSGDGSGSSGDDGSGGSGGSGGDGSGDGGRGGDGSGDGGGGDGSGGSEGAPPARLVEGTPDAPARPGLVPGAVATPMR